MMLWRDRGGVPLLTVLLLMACVCVGAAVTVATYRQGQPEVTVLPPTEGAPRTTIQLDDLATQVATEVAHRLDLNPDQRGQVAEVVTDSGRAGVQIVVPQTPPSTTTTSTTTTTQPPPTTRPAVPLIDLGEIVDSLVDP